MFMRLVEDEHSIYEMDEACIRKSLDDRENAQPPKEKSKPPQKEEA